MLKNSNKKWLFLTTYLTVAFILIWSAAQHQLFSDEAFYWLESQNLAWSYAELPGWTQWMIALSQSWLVPSELTIRLPSLVAILTLPWIAMSTSQAIQKTTQPSWDTGLLFLSLPLLLLAGMLALPDIWVIFFGTTAVLLLINCLQQKQWYWFALLGLNLAIGVNTHVRFWLVIFIAALVILWQYRSHTECIKKITLISFPVMLLGFIPIVLFNVQHDFPLLNFQFNDRHPWTFQIDHFKFFVIQLLVTTPIFFVLFWLTVSQYKQYNSLQKSLIGIAVIHWLMYALLGFFSDDIRFNWHWTLFSYTLIAVVIGSSNTKPQLTAWAQITGLSCGISFMVWLFWALHISQPISNLTVQFTENARGWKELATETDKLIEQTNSSHLVTDHFKTLASLAFYMNKEPKISSLSHPLNEKHGRQLQIEIMGYSQTKTTEKQLLVVEHSALKADQITTFYQQTCEQLNGIKPLKTFSYQNDVKRYYYFETGSGGCEIPSQ